MQQEPAGTDNGFNLYDLKLNFWHFFFPFKIIEAVISKARCLEAS